MQAKVHLRCRPTMHAEIHSKIYECNKKGKCQFFLPLSFEFTIVVGVALLFTVGLDKRAKLHSLDIFSFTIKNCYCNFYLKLI